MSVEKRGVGRPELPAGEKKVRKDFLLKPGTIARLEKHIAHKQRGKFVENAIVASLDLLFPEG